LAVRNASGTFFKQHPCARFDLSRLAARRVMENREALRAPLAELATKRKDALAELAAAESARPATAESSRVNAAEAAQKTADAAVRDKAADKGCRENCRMLLQSAVDAAQREVAAARAEFDELTSKESARLEDCRTAARAVAATLPPERSATPLADRLHVPGWALDLLVAALRSIAANGLGAALIAFGAHGKSERVNRRPAEQTTLRTIVAISLPASTARDHAIRFSRDVLTPSDANTPVAKLHPAYLRWCRSNDQTLFPTREIGLELVGLFDRSGIEIVDVDGTKCLARARIKTDNWTLGQISTRGA
jgi:hypothetical protein